VRQFLLAPDERSAWGRQRKGRGKADPHVSQASGIRVEILFHAMIFGRSIAKNSFVTTSGHVNN
jgi:hypothetical protein